jgi:hypothetical protein
MSESRPAFDSVATQIESHQLVPAARPMSQFSIEWIGDDVVMFDAGLNRYHTLNRIAYDIWRMCDGVCSVAQIARELDRDSVSVEAAIAQLGESGLLLAADAHFDSRFPRRQLLKLVTAGVLGAAAIPVVTSITVPDSVSAQTPTCSATSQCQGQQCCCAVNGQPTGTCVAVQGCTGQAGHVCLN